MSNATFNGSEYDMKCVRSECKFPRCTCDANTKSQKDEETTA